MMISYREAYLGQRPLQPPKKSEWVHMKSNSIGEGWSAEAFEMGATAEARWAPEEANVFSHYVYSERQNKFIHKRDGTLSMYQLWPSPGWDFWYHPDKKIYVILENMFTESLELIPATLADAESRI